MSDKRRGLGRGLGALIPSGSSAAVGERPVDVFFPGKAASAESDQPASGDSAETAETTPAVDAAGETTTAEGSDVAPGSSRDASPGVDDVGLAAEAAPVQRLVPPMSGSGPLSVAVSTTMAGPSGVSPSAVLAPLSAPAAYLPSALPAGQSPSIARVSRETPTSATAPPSVSRETDLVPVPGATFAEIPVGSIVPNSRQPRTVFDEDEMAELVNSVREIGVLQPIVVRPLAEPGRYELIMGERRWRASTEAGLAVVPAIIRETMDDDLLRDALLENLHRSQLNPLEEAAAYHQLLDDFGCTHDELAARIGRSRPQISNTLRLLRLPPLVQRRVAAGVLSAGHARALLGLTEGAAIERLAQRIVAEGLSVRTIEEIVAVGGDDEPAVRGRQPRAGGRQGELDELAQRLSDRFDTRVQIALGRKKGRLSVEFASVEDLNRIVALLAPGDAAFPSPDPAGSGQASSR